MKQQNEFDKIFKIAVLGLLILILTFQISSLVFYQSNSPFNSEYVVDIGYNDLFLTDGVYEEEKSFSSSYDIYTYQEFEKLIKTSIKNNEDLINYANNNNYTIKKSGDYSIIEMEEKCTHDNIRNLDLCLTRFIEANKENDQIILSTETTFKEIIINENSEYLKDSE